MEIKTNTERRRAETYLVASGATYEEYLELEERSELRHEFYNGRITAMAGGTSRHDLVAGNIRFYLRQKLKRLRCKIHSGDFRVQTSRRESYLYPDAFVVCHPIAPGATYATDPVAVFEVLSKSTRNKDRGEKFERYRQIAALRHYVLVDQYKAEVEHRRRTEADQWTNETLNSLEETLHLDAIPVEITLNEIYEDISFD